MLPHYRDYFWKKGIPSGTDRVDNPSREEKTYKIVSDPYRKQFSVEAYSSGKFTHCVYNSSHFDFRYLKAEDQMAWQKEPLWEIGEKSAALIRNGDDRVILKEVYRFTDQICRECTIYTPQDHLVAVQKIYFVNLGDPFNGVILYDANDHVVMKKTYAVNEENQFTHLLEEVSEFSTSL